ncbi:Rad2 nuclease [Aphanomyces cochlioides]|nr:Rad2 nuclease [Aphanomyces cochlioides]
MGVKDLLIHLRGIMNETHLSRYRGKRAGIDISGWLYAGAFSCASELAIAASNGVNPLDVEHTEPYEMHCIARLELLLKYDITPILVFEGRTPPTKAATTAGRSRERALHLQKGFQLLAEGEREKSHREFTRAVKVTTDMARKFRRTLVKKHPSIECIIAPYEADAELAFLSKIQYVDIVISEDADCVPYGCKTVLFKLNSQGQAEEFRRRHIGACENFSFVGWSDLMFLQLCVLAGCDYCPTIPNVGFVTAYKIVKECKTPDKILEYLGRTYDTDLPPAFAASFFQALLTFRHQIVYDPENKSAAMLNDWNTSEDDVLPWFEVEPDSYLGNVSISNAIARGIAEGNLNPTTYAPYEGSRVTAAFHPMPIRPVGHVTLKRPLPPRSRHTHRRKQRKTRADIDSDLSVEI